jgi:hypothetical protein
MKTILVSAAVAAIALSFAGVRTLAPFTSSVAAAETAHAAPRTEIAPSPAVINPPTQLGCADAVLCVGDCKKGDASCVAECEAAIGNGMSLYHALMSCADEHACDGDALCARKNCGAQLNSCLGASAPEGGCR